MKLYTKEDIKKVISLSRQSYGYDGYKFDEDEIFKELTPIELPSDEEMKVIALNIANTLKDKLDSREEAFYLGGFQTCNQWLKEQILNQNK